MSRIPRVLEHLKTGFVAEATAAAKFRAYAARADADGLPNLARHWLRLAAEKDELARVQLEAAGKVRGGAADLGAEIAEERYENEVLYPKLIVDVGDPQATEVFTHVVAEQKDHLARLEELRSRLTSSRGDVELPAETASTAETATAAPHA